MKSSNHRLEVWIAVLALLGALVIHGCAPLSQPARTPLEPFPTGETAQNPIPSANEAAAASPIGAASSTGAASSIGAASPIGAASSIGATASSTGAAASSSGAAAPGPRLMRFEQISVDQGLSQSVVEATAQDQEGFLWFATQDGLNRYDGYSFKIFRSDPTNPHSLSHSHTTALLASRQGGLWVGTYSGGLNYFDPVTGQFTRYRHDPQQPGSLSSETITALLEDSQGQLWVGTFGGLDRFDPQTGTFIHYRSDPNDPHSLSSNRITALLEARDGSLWVGTSLGLDHFDRASQRFRHYQNDPQDSHSLAGRVKGLVEDRQGRIWASLGEQGLDRFDPTSGRFEHYRHNPQDRRSLSPGTVNAVYEDRAGVVWVGVAGGGLCQYEPEPDQFTCYRHTPALPDSRSSDNVISIYEDRSGILWVGTYGGGVNKLLPGYKPFRHLYRRPDQPAGLSSNMIFALYQDEPHTLWVGTSGAGLDRLDRATGQVTNYRFHPDDSRSLSNDRVRVIYRDQAGALWVGTVGGLNRLDDPLGGRFTRFLRDAALPGNPSGNNITGICEDPHGSLWISSEEGGLNRYDRASGAFIHYPPDPQAEGALPAKGYSSLYCDRSGGLWAGTMLNGLIYYDPRTEQVRHYRHDPDNPLSLSDDFILTLFQDRAGGIWAGTTAGLNHYDPANDSFRSYYIRDGLPNDFIYALLEDTQGRLWISTNKGLSRFDPSSGQFKNYDYKDGLQSDEFNMAAAFQTRSGELLFGGINGITAFYPDQIHDNPYQPPVVLTSLTQHGEEMLAEVGLNHIRDIEVRWPDNFFDFEFAALNYTRPEMNRYAYKLEGFDRDWNDLGTRHSGRYTNLPGGTYTLRMRAANNDGLWNEAGIALRVRVVPPLWGTWWFRGMAVMLLAGAAFGGVRLRVRAVESRNLELERMVQARANEIKALYEQTKELAVIEERNRLARDLHDSAKQKAFAALAQLGAANGLIKASPPKAHNALVEAETLVYEVIEELTFLIQEMYPAALKEKGLANVLREYFYEWEGRTDIQTHFDIQNEYPLALQIEQALYRVTQEALANVARHSRASRVDIQVIYRADQVTISICDDGQGFNLNRPSGVGMRSMRERITLIGGQLMIDSAPGKGTRVSVCVPLAPALLNLQTGE